MKKVIAVIMILVIGINISACNTKDISFKESEKNYIKYGQQIENFTQKYGYHLEKLTEEYIANNNIKTHTYLKDYKCAAYLIDLKDSGHIIICFTNFGSPKNKGPETVGVDYIQTPNGRNFNLEIFVELFNIFSCKEIDIISCQKLLYLDNSIEEPINSQIGRREFQLDFWGLWYLCYELYEDKEVLSCGQKTKASTTIAYKVAWLSLIFILTCAGIIVTYRDIRKQKRLKKLYFKTPTI